MNKLILFFTFFLTFIAKILSAPQFNLKEMEMDSLEKDKVLACVELITKKYDQDKVK